MQYCILLDTCHKKKGLQQRRKTPVDDDVDGDEK